MTTEQEIFEKYDDAKSRSFNHLRLKMCIHEAYEAGRKHEAGSCGMHRDTKSIEAQIAQAIFEELDKISRFEGFGYPSSLELYKRKYQALKAKYLKAKQP
jgi:hypothetical protein